MTAKVLATKVGHEDIGFNYFSHGECDENISNIFSESFLDNEPDTDDILELFYDYNNKTYQYFLELIQKNGHTTDIWTTKRMWLCRSDYDDDTMSTEVPMYLHQFISCLLGDGWINIDDKRTIIESIINTIQGQNKEYKLKMI